MRTFFTATNYVDLRTEYKKLALLHHPDRGGDTATMQDINNEYERLSKVLINKTEFTQQRKDFEMNASEGIMEKVNMIVTLPDVFIEICGSWIWVTGNTRAVKDELKAAEFRFSSNKLAWYYHLDGYRKRNGKKFGLDEIRNMWGSEFVGKRERENALC